MKHQISTINLICEAADLLSVDGENVEYDRAITELVTNMLEVHPDYKDKVQEFLRAVK